MIPTCDLAKDLKISRIITGLWQIADLERKGILLEPEQTNQAIHTYVTNGFTTFDMADHYGSAEKITGNYKKRIKEDQHIELLTKWVPSPGRIKKKDVIRAVDTSLERMQSDQLDLLQFHAWNYADPNWLDCLYWLQELKIEGKIKHLGLTNVDAPHLRIAIQSGIDIVSNQISYSLLDQRAAGEMTKTCEELGVHLICFGILGGGFLTEKWIRKLEPSIDRLDTWSQMKYKRYIDVIGGWSTFQELLRCLEKIARFHDVSMATVAAKYMLDQPAVGAIILGARLGINEHIQENLRITQLALSEEELTMIKKVIERFDPIPGNCGDEYRKPPFLTAIGDLSHHLDSIPPPYTPLRAQGSTQYIDSGTKWESIAGFARAVKKGNRILVSGTTATHKSKLIGGNDPIAQTHFIIDKIQGAIESLGGALTDVIRTRIYIQREDIWEAVARVHGERFGTIRPANTLVKAGLIGDGYLVEMEAEAEI